MHDLWWSSHGRSKDWGTRLWYAEHHNMPGIATTPPEILIAHVGSATSRIRLGAGVVMLPNPSAPKVAAAYRLLEALHPGRIGNMAVIDR